MFLTHRFYVELKDKEDFSHLQEMVKKYNAEIEKEDDTFPLWYILRCGLPTSYNALELANIFHESGLFAASEPEFMGAVCMDDETALPQVSNSDYEHPSKIIIDGMLVIKSGGKMYNAQGIEIK